ncbi:hypothetical protein DH2020_023516 [Rehmannia glutinosa]|uniref:Uncharacterized protein n=1 Tax=Rehmannia glutinosa TaxID=99300 RepID=A0ABR0W694_REHGL
MGLRVKHALLLLLFIVVFSLGVTAEHEKENTQRLITAPRRNAGGVVIDGSGVEHIVNSDKNGNEMGEWQAGNNRVSVSTVAIFTVAMAAATGLGVMLAASFDLIQEGQGHGSGSWVVLGILAGGIFIWLCKKHAGHKGAEAAKVILVVGIMTLHSFGRALVSEFPLLALKPIVAVPSFICADAFNKFLPFATGFAAGCMIWMVMAEVLPDGFKESSPSHVASAATLSVAFMEALGALFEHFTHSYNPEDASGFFVSLLFGLGPLLGGIALVAFALSFRLQHALLTGLASGIAFILGAWRPLQLLLSSKMGLIPLLFLLALGSASVHVLYPLLQNSEPAKTSANTLSAVTGFSLSALTLQSVLSCVAVALHALAEGLALGVAAPKAYGLGRHMVLPVSLHGFRVALLWRVAFLELLTAGMDPFYPLRLSGLWARCPQLERYLLESTTVGWTM